MVVKVKNAETKRNKASVAHTGWNKRTKTSTTTPGCFTPHASSYQNTELPRLYRQHERAKKSKYARRVAEIEHGCFTPLVFTTSGGMAPEATTFFRRLAGLVSEKRGSSYSATMNWIRCCLSFSLLRSSLLCIRGSRSTQRTFCNTACNVALIAAECRL